MNENLSIFDIELKKNVDAKELTTMKASAKVKIVFYPKSEKELIFIYNYLAINNIKFMILGNGSNVIFSINAQHLAVISTKKLPIKITRRENTIHANCSANLSEIYKYCQKNSLSGFERLAGIPGSLGGAIIMNASAFNRSISDYLVSIKILKNGRILNIKKEKIYLSYRDGGLQDCLILSAKFNLPKKDKCLIEKDFIKYQYLRQEKQPKGFSAGSIFKNPPLLSAGKLIEESGLKGFRIGGALISEKHANFIINDNQATSKDVIDLISLTKAKVYEKYKIKLEEEVRII